MTKIMLTSLRLELEVSEIRLNVYIIITLVVTSVRNALMMKFNTV